MEIERENPIVKSRELSLWGAEEGFCHLVFEEAVRAGSPDGTKTRNGQT